MSSRKYPYKVRRIRSDTARLERFQQLTGINPNNPLVNPETTLYCLFLDEPIYTMKGCFFCHYGYCYLKSQTSCPRTHDPEMNPELRPIHPTIQSVPTGYTWEGIHS